MKLIECARSNQGNAINMLVALHGNLIQAYTYARDSKYVNETAFSDGCYCHWL